MKRYHLCEVLGGFHLLAARPGSGFGRVVVLHKRELRLKETGHTSFHKAPEAAAERLLEWLSDRATNCNHPTQTHRQRQTMQMSRPWETGVGVLDECLWLYMCVTTGLFSKACFPSSSTQMNESFN